MMPKNVDQQVSITDNFNTDAFGRLRTSAPIAQFEYQNQYNKGPLIWAEKVNLSGTITHIPATSSVELSTGSGSATASVIRQTRQYFRYTPGKSLKVILTFDCGPSGANVRMCAGYFDGENGIFFMHKSGRNYLVLRSKATGSIVDTEIPQESWNRDRLDGAGDSGLRLDFEKAQIFLMDIQWLGVGSVRCGFEYNGVAYYVHEFEHTNALTHVYMATANLPIRYEIDNIGPASGSATLTQICSTVVTEQGAIDDKGFYTHGAGNGITAISVTSRRSILAIRPKATINSIVNRGKIEVEDISILAGGANVYWELVYGGTLGGSPSWSSISDNSLIERDVAGTTVTGGEVIASGYAPTGAGAARALSGKAISALYPLALDIDGGTPPVLALVCTSFTGTATVTASINVKEYY